MLTRLSTGDNAAFSQLYNRYSVDVFSFIILYVKDDMVAEDLLQTVFLRCWERRGELAVLRSLKDFLFIVTRNLVYDHLRHMAVRVKQLEDTRLQTWYLPGWQADEGYGVLEKELHHLYQQAISKLTPQQQEVYRRHAEQEQSLDEIAAAMMIAKATVKKHLEIARRSIRNYITSHRSDVPLLLLPMILGNLSFT